MSREIKMTKATETASVLLIVAALYLALYTGVIPVCDKVRNEILPFFPWWCLVAFGSFSLGTLGYDVLTFNDKEEKYHELLKVSFSRKIVSINNIYANL